MVPPFPSEVAIDSRNVKVPPSSILEVIDTTWINAASQASAHIPVGYQEVVEAMAGFTEAIRVGSHPHSISHILYRMYMYI